MRKNNDGYVIIYVVFIILFLCIVAVGTCTAALNNLKTQNAAVEQMRNRYDVESEIEKRVADMCTGINNLKSKAEDSPKPLDTLDPDNDIRIDAIAGIKEFFATTTEPTKVSATENIYTYIYELSETKTNYTVKATVEFQFEISFPLYTDKEGNTTTKRNDWPADAEIIEETSLYSYSVGNATSKYITYTIEYTGGAA